MEKLWHYIHKPHILCYQYYRLTGILTQSLTSNSEPINKLLNEIYKPTLSFAARCLDMQNVYSRLPFPKVPMGFLIPWRNTCQPPSQTPSDINWGLCFLHLESPVRTFFISYQPPSQTPGDSDNFGLGNKKPARRSEREKLNNMQQQHNTLRMVPCKSHLAGHCYTWVQIALQVVHRCAASPWFAFQRTVSPLTVRVRLLDLLASSP